MLHFLHILEKDCIFVYGGDNSDKMNVVELNKHSVLKGRDDDQGVEE